MDLENILPRDSISFSDSHSNSPLMDQLNSQRELGSFCDITFKINEKELHAHRNILAANSPYFASVLKMHKTVKENLTVACNSDDIFSSILRYVYCGNIIINESNVSEILRLSNHFLLSKLKNYCSEFLNKHINIATCLLVKDIAEKYCLTDLLKSAILYIQNNIIELLKSTDLLAYPPYRLEPILEDKSWKIPTFSLLEFIENWVLFNEEDRVKELRTLLTFVDWKSLEKSIIDKHLLSSQLFSKNSRCLYYCLESLECKGIFIDLHKTAYDPLKTKHNTLTPDVDSESFFSLAISAAIKQFQSTENHLNSSAFSLLPAKEKENSVPEDDDEVNDKNDDEESNNSNSQIIPADQNVDPKLKNSRKRGRPKKPLSSKSDEPTAKQPVLTSRGRKIEPPRRFLFDEQPSSKNTSAKLGSKLSAMDNVLKDPSQQPEETDDNNDDLSDSEELRMDEKEKKTCPHCSFSARGTLRLEQHLLKVHSKSMTYKCRFCEFTCNWNREYYAHMKTHFTGPPYQCDECDYSHEWLHALLLHRMKHTDEKPYHCEQCQFRCHTKPTLAAHVKLHSTNSNVKPFTCPTCDKSFGSKHALEQHVSLKHKADHPFTCSTCGYATKHQSHLISHLRIHTGEILFCQYPNCNYKSPKKSVLESHMRIHTAVRSHVCNVCGRAFLEKSHLVRHERIHLSEKPFKCDKCEYGSTRRDKLKEHWQKHHSEHATAKTPYKPRKPRRQTFDPMFFPGRSDVSTPTINSSESLDSTSYSSQNILNNENSSFISIY